MIDLRSDTVTTPCNNMRRVMANAEVGDDVYEEDLTVKHLESKLAEMVGHEKGLFVPSGTQSNLVALLSHCQRGDEYIVAQHGHTYRYEAGGAAVLGGIQPQPITAEADGTIDLNTVALEIKADDFHFARTRLLALENTTNGKAVSLDYIARAASLTQKHKLGLHLDGARIFNGAIALRVPAAQIADHFDSVSICLSKGLGAPVGSVLCSNRDLIDRARRWRKMLGGGMRQAGMLAAAGIYALDHNIDRLQQDHDHAKLLADELMRRNPDVDLQVIGGKAHTNMVFISLPNHDIDALRAHAKAHHLLLGTRVALNTLRLVTHRQISEPEILSVVQLITNFLQAPASA